MAKSKKKQKPINKNNSKKPVKKDRSQTWKAVILAVAIALVFTFFVAYLIQVIYEPPEYEDYCNETGKPILPPNITQQECEDLGGKWDSFSIRPVSVEDTGYCDLYYECREDYDTARDQYERNIFFITLVIGVIAIILGIILTLQSVSLGLMLGGIITILYGTMRSWGQLSELLRVIMLGAVLALLIWLGYKKVKA